VPTADGSVHGPGSQPSGQRYHQTPLLGAPGGGWGEGSRWAVRDADEDELVLDGSQDDRRTWTGTEQEALDKARDLNHAKQMRWTRVRPAAGQRGADTVTVTQDDCGPRVLHGLAGAVGVRQAVYGASDTWRGTAT
jgi:hypothetical protein